eukprot:COSAG06_NODE_54475_length_294_cov_0.969231_1_plen_30_part_01
MSGPRRLRRVYLLTLAVSHTTAPVLAALLP